MRLFEYFTALGNSIYNRFNNLDSNSVSSLLSLNVGLLAVVITIVALIPALLEILRNQKANVFAKDAARFHMAYWLKMIRNTIWIFGLTTILSTILLVSLYVPLLILDFILTLIGLVVLLKGVYGIAKYSSDMIGEKNV